MSQRVEQDNQPGGFDLREITLAFYKGWYIVAICAAVSVWYGIHTLHNTTYLYVAQMQITPPPTADSTNNSNRFNNLGAIGAMVGALPVPQGFTQFALYVEMLKSRDLADELAKDPELMHTVFQDYWNAQTQSWQPPPPGRFDGVIDRIRSFLGLRPAVRWRPPDGESLQGFMAKNLDVAQDALKPYLVKVVFRFPDPNFAVGFLNTLSSTADNMLREKALLRGKRNIDYLSKELNSVTIAEQRAAIAETLSGEEQYAMTAGSGAPFSADVFERPWTLSIPTEPKGQQIIEVDLFLGIAVGGALALAFRRFRRQLLVWLTTKLRSTNRVAPAP